MIRLSFSGLPSSLRETLEVELNAAKGHVFLGMDHVEVIRHSDGLVFRLNNGKGGYTFCKTSWYGEENDVQTFRRFLHDPIQSLYMPIAYEVKEPGEFVVNGIIERYANHGSHHATKIAWLWYEREERHLLILRIPKEIVGALMYRHGGVLTTQVRGPVAAIRQLPVLSRIVPEEAKDDEIMHRAFITPYSSKDGEGTEYDQCLAIHQAALREVVAAKACGISIGPLAVWSP